MTKELEPSLAVWLNNKDGWEPVPTHVLKTLWKKEGSRSLCNLLLQDVFRLSDSEYRAVVQSIDGSRSLPGSYQSNHEPGSYVLAIELPRSTIGKVVGGLVGGALAVGGGMYIHKNKEAIIKAIKSIHIKPQPSETQRTELHYELEDKLAASQDEIESETVGLQAKLTESQAKHASEMAALRAKLTESQVEHALEKEALQAQLEALQAQREELEGTLESKQGEIQSQIASLLAKESELQHLLATNVQLQAELQLENAKQGDLETFELEAQLRERFAQMQASLLQNIESRERKLGLAEQEQSELRERASKLAEELAQTKATIHEKTAMFDVDTLVYVERIAELEGEQKATSKEMETLKKWIEDQRTLRLDINDLELRLEAIRGVARKEQAELEAFVNRDASAAVELARKLNATETKNSQSEAELGALRAELGRPREYSQAATDESKSSRGEDILEQDDISDYTIEALFRDTKNISQLCTRIIKLNKKQINLKSDCPLPVDFFTDQFMIDIAQCKKEGPLPFLNFTNLFIDARTTAKGKIENLKRHYGKKQVQELTVVVGMARRMSRGLEPKVEFYLPSLDLTSSMARDFRMQLADGTTMSTFIWFCEEEGLDDILDITIDVDAIGLGKLYSELKLLSRHLARKKRALSNTWLYMEAIDRGFHTQGLYTFWFMDDSGFLNLPNGVGRERPYDFNELGNVYMNNCPIEHGLAENHHAWKFKLNKPNFCTVQNTNLQYVKLFSRGARCD
jgi:hypothetical protein